MNLVPDQQYSEKDEFREEDIYLSDFNTEKLVNAYSMDLKKQARKFKLNDSIAHSLILLVPQGTIPVDSLIEKAKEYALPAIALTDTNGMYGLIEFMKKAKEANIKPIPGAFIDDPADKNINAVFLAMNRRGYSDLCKIITTRKLKENFSLKKSSAG